MERLLLNDPHISKYHIIRFYDDVTNDRTSGDYFLVNINSYGLMSVALILLEELDSIEILENMEKIMFHNVYFPNASEIKIDENAKIVVFKEDLHTNIIFEAQNQKWYIPIENGYFKNKYFSGTQKLLLFSAYNSLGTDLRNCDRTERFYPQYFQRTLEYKLLLKEGKMGTQEFDKAYGMYRYLNWYSHPTPFSGLADSFDSWAKKQEGEFVKSNE